MPELDVGGGAQRGRVARPHHPALLDDDYSPSAELTGRPGSRYPGAVRHRGGTISRTPAPAASPSPTFGPDLGALPEADGVRFRVWAPRCRRVDVRVLAPGPEALVPLAPGADGVFEALVPGVRPGARYRYRLDGGAERPDPVSRSQPEGVHGPSEVVDPRAFAWSDAAWRGVPRRDLCLYELHVGTFTDAGTFDGVVPHLAELRDLGLTAIELMPVAEFPGGRNWGYDGVHLYAPQSTYGGPEGLRRLVDAAHRVGLAVLLDVVYNHLGPEGNYLADYGPYVSTRERTPWGPAVDYDGDGSTGVRRHVVGNARHWVREYHLDGVRLDAVHAIRDGSPTHLLAELGDALEADGRALGREVHVIAESNRNDRRIVLPRSRGGYGLAAQWSDDLHHALHVTLTGARGGYYEDFQGGLDDLEVALRSAWVFQGRFSTYRGFVLGTEAGDLPGEAFVVFAQNHDQVGNQARGDRLATRLSLAALKVAAATVLCAPYLPLLFMGEEYGETAPFAFFTGFLDPALGDAVRVGRRREFVKFAWDGEVPDPQDPATFTACRLDRRRRAEPPQAWIAAWYQALLRLRSRHAALRAPDRPRTAVTRAGSSLVLHRAGEGGEAAWVVLGYGRVPMRVELAVPEGRWRRALDSEAPEFGGAGTGAPDRLGGGGVTALALSPYHALVYLREAGAGLSA
ncbi:MAG: malto-oligosyltrehalose trehalohydrolase [Candidatus Rokubacteria bacterium]|nr:malto-oligosyltrehalose trehalohydrolase [Candidatus Rokubacteria bacterium]